jgi:hypothetical protein
MAMSEGRQNMQESAEDLEPLLEEIRKVRPSLKERLETYRKQRKAYEAMRSRRTGMPRPAATEGREYHV